jgi:hypothetical protein
MPSSSEIQATLCLCGGLIRRLTSALTTLLYRRIGHVLKPAGVLMRGVTSFPNPGAHEDFFSRSVVRSHSLLLPLNRHAIIHSGILGMLYEMLSPYWNGENWNNIHSTVLRYQQK